VRQRGADYLLFALLDSVVDNYYNTLDKFEEVIEEIEDRISEDQNSNDKSSIHKLKKELLVLRKSIAPLREVISKFSKSDSAIIQDKTHIYIRNLYENTIQVIDSIDSYRDMLNSLQDLFIAEVSFKMNKVMQLLTLISVIFIPLTFLAGIYGMNFEYIPELQYKYGYFILLGVMFCLFLILLFLFKRKKWM
jgi:magnesium transporter